MGKFSEKALAEAKRVVSDLNVQTSQGKTFESQDFISALSEEIESLWTSDVKGAFVSFHLVENGSLVYSGLTDGNTTDPTSFSIPFLLKLEEHSAETVRMSENLLQLEIATKKNKLLDKLLNEGKSSENI